MTDPNQGSEQCDRKAGDESSTSWKPCVGEICTVTAIQANTELAVWITHLRIKMEVYTLAKTSQIWSWNISECIRQQTSLPLLLWFYIFKDAKKYHQKCYEIIYKVFVFPKFEGFFQEYPASLNKHIQKPQWNHFRFILKPRFGTVSLLSGGILTAEVFHSSFSLLLFIYIVQSLLVKML